MNVLNQCYHNWYSLVNTRLLCTLWYSCMWTGPIWYVMYLDVVVHHPMIIWPESPSVHGFQAFQLHVSTKWSWKALEQGWCTVFHIKDWDTHHVEPIRKSAWAHLHTRGQKLVTWFYTYNTGRLNYLSKVCPYATWWYDSFQDLATV